MMYANAILKIFQRGFPIINWTKNYNAEQAIADLVAGITIGLTLIPQSIAYASLAGLSPQYGLYSSLCGGIVYAIFGTIPELNIAPTALLSLLTISYTNHLTTADNDNKIQAVVLLCLLSGIIELLCGLLHLGFLVDFVSTPVVAGFTSAGALTIASSQIKNLLGVKFSAETFIGVWFNVFRHIRETDKSDTLLGLGCCVILLCMRKLKDCGLPPLDNNNSSSSSSSSKRIDDNERMKSKSNNNLKKLIWFSSVSRNAVVVISCAVAAYCLKKYNNYQPFSLTSKVPAGLPNLTLPTIIVAGSSNSNSSITSTIDIISQLNTGIFVVPFIAILGNVAIAKSFAKGKVVDATQEMIAVGICNIIGAFIGSYPVNASFSRAAVSNASGVKTPLAGIYTSIIVILALTFLTPYFSFIPKATLAAVIISAVIFMVEVTVTKSIWYINKKDLTSFIVTFVSCLLLGIEIGILIGIGVDLVSLLYFTARPNIHIEKITDEDNTFDYFQVTPSSAILFPSVEFLRDKLMKIDYEKSLSNDLIIIIDCLQVNKIDFTAGKCLGNLVSDFNKSNNNYNKQQRRRRIIFYRPIKSIAKIMEQVGRENDCAIVIAQSASDLQEIFKEHKSSPPSCQNVLNNNPRTVIDINSSIIIVDDSTVVATAAAEDSTTKL